jgi:hypothetical protein
MDNEEPHNLKALGMKSQRRYWEDTGGIQEGYREDTGRIQEGYRKDTGGIEGRRRPSQRSQVF